MINTMLLYYVDMGMPESTLLKLRVCKAKTNPSLEEHLLIPLDSIVFAFLDLPHTKNGEKALCLHLVDGSYIRLVELGNVGGLDEPLEPIESVSELYRQLCKLMFIRLSEGNKK